DGCARKIEEQREVARRRERAIERESKILIGLGLEHERNTRREHVAVDPIVVVETRRREKLPLIRDVSRGVKVSTELGHLIVVLVAAVDRTLGARVGLRVVETVNGVQPAESHSVLNLCGKQARLIHDRRIRAKELGVARVAEISEYLGEETAASHAGLNA